MSLGDFKAPTSTRTRDPLTTIRVKGTLRAASTIFRSLLMSILDLLFTKKTHGLSLNGLVKSLHSLLD